MLRPEYLVYPDRGDDLSRLSNISFTVLQPYRYSYLMAGALYTHRKV
jgi:hypothetical protein